MRRSQYSFESQQMTFYSYISSLLGFVVLILFYFITFHKFEILESLKFFRIMKIK